MNTFQTRKKVLNTEDVITCQFGMNWLTLNSSAYFSITAEIEHRGRVDCCGCLHKEIAKSFPELAPLIKWHLCDAPGLPMHYIANALYWRDCLLGKYPRRDYDPEPVSTFTAHVLYGTVPGDEAMPVEERMRAPGLEAWLEGRKAALSAAFREEMASFGVKMIDKP
jgi:hypothetical protein